MDFVGPVHSSLPLSATERHGIDNANTLAAKRSPSGRSPIDRGFGPAIVARRAP